MPQRNHSTYIIASWVFISFKIITLTCFVVCLIFYSTFEMGKRIHMWSYWISYIFNRVNLTILRLIIPCTLWKFFRCGRRFKILITIKKVNVPFFLTAIIPSKINTKSIKIALHINTFWIKHNIKSYKSRFFTST